MPETILKFDAILFDMDGTLVDSAAGVHGAWNLFAQQYPGIDVHQILSSSHGVRTVDNLRIHCGVTDPDELEREAVRFEEAIVTSASQDGGKGIVALPGVMGIINEARSADWSPGLLPGAKLPKPCWAICTSATRNYATKALGAAGLPVPDVFVVAEDVTQGKPEPDPYLLGAKKCGVEAARCLVVEDAPNGVRSGNSAGCTTLALLTTHPKEQVEASNPNYIVQDLSSVTMKRLEEGGVEVIIKS